MEDAEDRSNNICFTQARYIHSCIAFLNKIVKKKKKKTVNELDVDIQL